MELIVERSAAAIACPDGAALSARVSARAETSPLESGPARVLRVRFLPSSLRPGALVAEITIEEDGVGRGQRTLGPAPADCVALAEAVSLAVGLVLVPLVPLVPFDPPVAVPAAAEVSLRRPGRPRVRAPLGVELAVGGSTGVAPGLGPVIVAGLFARNGELRMAGGVELHAPLPVIVDGSRRIESRALVLRMDGCMGPDLVTACLGLAGGGAQVDGIGFRRESPMSVPVLLTAASVGVRAPLGAGLSVVGRASVGVPILRTRLVAPEGAMWASPLLNASFSVGLSWGVAG